MLSSPAKEAAVCAAVCYSGTFCTSDYVVGVAARSHASAVNHATFFIYGVEPSDDLTPADLPTMEMVS